LRIGYRNFEFLLEENNQPQDLGRIEPDARLAIAKKVVTNSKLLGNNKSIETFSSSTATPRGFSFATTEKICGSGRHIF